MIVSVGFQRMVRVKPEAIRHIERCQSEGKCLACDRKVPSGQRVIRGLCEACYQATLRAIGRGDFTQEERIKAGKLLARRPGGRQPSNPVTREARQ